MYEKEKIAKGKEGEKKRLGDREGKLIRAITKTMLEIQMEYEEAITSQNMKRGRNSRKTKVIRGSWKKLASIRLRRLLSTTEA